MSPPRSTHGPVEGEVANNQQSGARVSSEEKRWTHVILDRRVAAFRMLTGRFEFGRIHRHIDPATGRVISEWWVATGEVVK